MDILTASKFIAVLGTASVLVWFVLVATAHRFHDDPFFSSRTLNRSQIRANVAGTATSLAGALFFFMQNAAIFGWIMILVPIFNFLGILLFTKLAKRRDPDPEVTGSIYRLINHSYHSGPLSSVSNIIVVVNFVAVFVIEIAIGATIFGYLLGGKASFIPLIAFGLAAVSMWYVMKGGFSAVVNTDQWQVYLLFGGLLVTFMALISLSSEMDFLSTWQTIVEPLASKQVQYAFIANMILINITLPSSQISTWERYSAANSKEEAISGFWQGVAWGLVPLWALAIILAFGVISVDSSQSGFDGLFTIVFEKLEYAPLIVFPMLFIGLVAALLSTADSIMIATMLAVDDFISPERRQSLSTKQLMKYTGAGLIAASTLTSIVISLSPDIGGVITRALFAAYGLPCLLFPLIYYACKGKAIPNNASAFLFALAIGLVILVGTAAYGLAAGDFRSSILGPVVAIISVWLVMVTAPTLIRHARNFVRK